MVTEPEFMDEEEEVRITIPKEFRDIGAHYSDRTVRELWQDYMDEKVVLQADFQRYYVWDTSRACRFIESLILNMPVPYIYLAENSDGTLDVVDGHQRLESVFRFLQPLASGPTKNARIKPTFTPLTLKGLEVLGNELNGRDVTALSDDDRKRLFDRKIPVVLIPRTAHKDMKYVLFARLNLGSVALNPQELRNCLYRGPYNNLLKQVAGDGRVLAFFNMSHPHKRMKDCEMVLTFLAFAHRGDQYKPPFRLFLDDELEANRNCTAEEGQHYRSEFFEAMENVQKVFGSVVCRLFKLGNEDDPNCKWSPSRVDLVYEMEMLAMYRNRERIRAAENKVREEGGDLADFRQGLRRSLIRVMANEQFLDAILEGTKQPLKVNMRHSLAFQAIKVASDSPFNTIQRAKRVQNRFVRNQNCIHCKTLINSLDDAVIVARQALDEELAHRYCARSAQLPVLPD